jgi:thiol-disulfide isomerase/thioredoxin
MNIKKILLALLMLVFMSFANADKANLKPYQMGDWSTLVKSANNSPVAIHFWGVTCPACVKEMPLWGAYSKEQPNAKVIFVQVDDVSIESMQKMLAKAGLDKANNYFVAGPFDERLRYEIDPRWHGETPTTILIDQKGKAVRKTGLMDFQKLKPFLNIGT